MGKPILDSSLAGVYVAVFPETATLEEIREYYGELKALLEQPGPPIWFIVDLSGIEVLKSTAAHRKAAAEEYLKIAPLFERRVAGEAFVLDNPLVRGVYVAFWWLSGREDGVERATFASESKARAWVEAKSGLPVDAVPSFATVRLRHM